MLLLPGPAPSVYVIIFHLGQNSHHVKIYRLNHFKAYKSVALSAFAMCRFRHYFQTILITPKRSFTPISKQSLRCPSPQPALILFVSVGLLFLDVSYAQKRTVVTFIAWLLSLSIIVSRFIRVVTCQYCISFRGGIVFRCMDGPDRLAFTRSPVDGHLGVPTSRG